MLDVRRVLYFDHNATHPLSATAKRVWLEAVEKFPANPSSPHRLGQRAEAALDDARARLGKMLVCAPGEIVFTSGATEGANTVIDHALADGDEVWVSAIEHPCVMEAARTGRCLEIPVGGDGIVDLAWLERELGSRRPALVAVMAANNETGVLQPWRAAQDLCRQHAVPCLCDAAQWIGKHPSEGAGTCEFLTACAHKFGGPQGVGFIVCRSTMWPLLRGGPQEDGRRAGTENVASILAMAAALEERESAIRTGGVIDLLAQRVHFENELLAAVPDARIVGAGSERLWNTVSVIMPEQPDCRRRWVVVMDKLGFAVSTGSACASGKERPSHVLTAMGFTPEEAGRALRFSAGWETPADDWARLLEGVKAAVREMGL
jgi:cysteine desulfurase